MAHLFEILAETAATPVNDLWLEKANRLCEERAATYVRLVSDAELVEKIWANASQHQRDRAQFGLAIATEIRQELQYFTTWMENGVKAGIIRL